ncbi:MAG: hypothetical protein LH618_00985, partial [Saprospiraceae bacterium]|nr:hypothetical protein [Saprospiraceae bacterium]
MTNSSGTVVAEQNFDAWGRKRNPTNWTYVSIPAVPAWLYRGFTGHEHLPQFTLINMNGRLYDPIVGRMLSTDNNVQMPDFTQNYNRYSYALNNPLRFTDPDGEFIFLAFAIGILATAIQASQGNIGGPVSFFGTFAANFGASALGAGIASSGAMFANTLAIAGSSFTGSLATDIFTNSKSGVSISAGFASYSFTDNEFNYFGKRGNSVMENICFGFGSLANVQDLVAWNNGKDIV